MQKRVGRYYLWFLPAVFTVSFGGNWLFLESMRGDVSPQGGMDPFFPVGLMDAMLLMGVILSVPVGLALLLRRQNWWLAGFFLWGGIVYFAGGFIFCLFNESWISVRREAFRDLGTRLMPLVHAIDRYHIDQGTYPKDLNQLIPDYVERLPQTNMANYSKYRYLVGKDAQAYEKNPWVIEMSSGWGLGFDSFVYFPLQNYPRAGYGGVVERLGQWAYVWE